MRTQHTPHFLTTFPVYASAFLSPNHLVLGGGGGASRTGIKNKLRVYEVDEKRDITLVDDLELERGDDAPMSMAASVEAGTIVCGINSPEEKLSKGENENCRVYAFKEQKLGLVRTRGTLVSGDLEDYQRVTTLSPDGKLLVVAGTKSLQLLSFPSLTPEALAVTEKEIYDVSFSQNTIVVATTGDLIVYALPVGESESKTSPLKNKKKGRRKTTAPPELEVLRTVGPPTLPGSVGSDFRAARFHPTNSDILYTISNTIPGRSRGRKAAPRQAYICKWNVATWTSLKMKKVADKGLTCFDISPDGNLLGLGSSDCSISILDASTFAPLVKILKAHEFPPTTLKFNPTSGLLVSGSADNSIRIVSVPQTAGKSSWTSLIIIIITLLIVLLAIMSQQYL